MYNRHRLKKKISLIIIIVNITVIICLIATDSRLRSILTDAAVIKSHIVANTIINSEVNKILNEEDIKYTDIAEVCKDVNDNISSITVNTITVNKLKTQIVGKIQSAINSQDNIKLEIKMGTVIGNEYLIGRGPSLHFKMSMSSSVYSEINSTFYDAGINQTLHIVTLHITCKMYMYMPWYRSASEFETNLPLAETVIVGKVPEAYTNVIESPTSDIAGILNDYGAVSDY